MLDSPPSSCRLPGARLIVRLPEKHDAPAIAKFFSDNERHLVEFLTVPHEMCTAAFWTARIDTQLQDFLDGRACQTALFEPDDCTVIGAANLTQFVRGPFQAAYLGYSLARAKQGQGLMREALSLLIGFAFSELRLHRIMANYVPRNARSAAVLERLGFVTEGVAKQYLLINGVWEDHVLTSLTNEEWTFA